MKTAVIYYSMSGNSQFAAEKIAGQLNADLIRLEPEKAYPDSGFRKFFWGGKSAVMGERPALLPYDFDSDKYDLVILGFPVWASNPAPPIRSFIHDNKDSLAGKDIAAFACFSGGGADKALAKLKKQLEIDSLKAELILTDPREKEDPENDKMIREFCNQLSA